MTSHLSRKFPSGLRKRAGQPVQDRVESNLELVTEVVARGKDADAEDEVLAMIAETSESDRVMAERIHAVFKANAPELRPKLW